ncbi:hypothetical protein BGZ61DRAFT_583144 [Ilyonectria robusta]|uniref:uncharacterized protein n=1 Tax=Ilyonectria robusta TaxID=1079257 RepID=UPI001E8EC373|nr:uncharacterized protein BGZ61DRAFT_583144 [Ilyonectria robusta]KAH8738171.1 hypothetical protein BGZ61DRAFT_583144 [Ilyonectria robusta]
MEYQATPTSGSLLPPDSASSVAEMAALNANDFGAKVPAILASASRRIFKEQGWKDRPFVDIKAVRSRATEPPTIAAIATVLQSSLRDQDEFRIAWTAFYEVVVELPSDAIRFYRPALEALSATESRKQESTTIFGQPEAVWVPTHKGDYIGELSLQQRVTTAEQMRPHVTELLGWLADGNWPPFRGSRKQLARFPEVTVEPIRELMEKERGDGGWLLNLLEFVGDCVPVGPLWEPLRPVVQAISDDPKGDEDDWELSDCARLWLSLLHHAACRPNTPQVRKAPDIMGNNLSTSVQFDTSGAVFSPEDRASGIKLIIFWVSTLYVCAMIFSTCALVDRWKGPYDRIRTGAGSVMAALLLSTAWPVVMAYLLMAG